MSFPQYPKYKFNAVLNSDIPAHWTCAPLKRLVRIENGANYKHVEAAEGYPVIGSGGIFAYASEFMYDGDSVLFGRKGTIDKPLLVSGRFWTIDTMYWTRVLKPHDARFVYYLALTMPFAMLSTDTALPSMTKEALYSFQVPIPGHAEQLAIAAFLERETAKIDALIAEQKRLIELLKEKRQAVISHAVTKGLNPDAAMKPSGVKWLGDIPAHWEVTQSRRMFAVRSEPALTTDRMLTASQKYGVLFQSDFVEREGRRVVEVIMGVENLKHVEPDDFVISMRSFEGGIEWCRQRGSTSFHYVMIKPVKYVYPPYFAHLFKSITYIQALRATTDLIRDGQELRYSNFVQVPLPHVPILEQTEIATYLDGKTAELNALSAEAQRAVDLLQERRSALIQAAVTGQIDVRGLVEQKAA